MHGLNLPQGEIE